MKLIAESTREGWVNFGTIYQSYEKPYQIKVDKSGKVWRVLENGKKMEISNVEPFRSMTEDEAIKFYSDLAETETYITVKA